MLIERLFDLCKRHTALVTWGLPVMAVTTGFLIKRFRRVYTKTNRICGIDYPRDVVILHPLGRGITGPDTSHFVVKLETYLRFHNLPYKSDFNIDNFKLGPKRKVPWIEYNDVTLGDSQMIIEFLNKELNVDMDAHLSKQEKALAWAIQKWIEEFMYWISVQWTWVLFIDETFQEGISPFPLEEKSAIKDWVANMTYTAGERKYIFGDKMCTVDCSAFGIFSQMRWLTPKSCPCYKVFEDGEISNVVKYLDRIRDHYWPDWDNPRF